MNTFECEGKCGCKQRIESKHCDTLMHKEYMKTLKREQADLRHDEHMEKLLTFIAASYLKIETLEKEVLSLKDQQSQLIELLNKDVVQPLREILTPDPECQEELIVEADEAEEHITGPIGLPDYKLEQHEAEYYLQWDKGHHEKALRYAADTSRERVILKNLGVENVDILYKTTAQMGPVKLREGDSDLDSKINIVLSTLIIKKYNHAVLSKILGKKNGYIKPTPKSANSPSGNPNTPSALSEDDGGEDGKDKEK